MTEITGQIIPDSKQQPKVEFRQDDFRYLVYNKGYSVIHEKAIPCPCKEKGGDNLSSCRNCLSTGWVFIDPVRTRMIAQSMNVTTKFTEWSKEMIGTANITAIDFDRISFMDRITLEETQTVTSQVLYPKKYGSCQEEKVFAYANYGIIEIVDIFRFVDANSALVRLTDQQYSFVGQTLFFTINPLPQNFTVAVRYKHMAQYHIIDVINDIRLSNKFVSENLETIDLPLHAIARKSQYVLDSNNYSENILIPNE
jgi:hypothetical protein